MIDPSRLSALDRAAIQQQAATLQAVADRLRPLREMSREIEFARASVAAAAAPILDALNAIGADYLDKRLAIAASVADVEASWPTLGEDIRSAVAAHRDTFEAIGGQLRVAQDAFRLLPTLQTAFATATPTFLQQVAAAYGGGALAVPARDQSAPDNLVAQVRENATFLFWMALLYLVLFGGGYLLGSDVAAGPDHDTTTIRDAIGVAGLLLVIADKVLKASDRSEQG